jgi:hypothetical protein
MYSPGRLLFAVAFLSGSICHWMEVVEAAMTGLGARMLEIRMRCLSIFSV